MNVVLPVSIGEALDKLTILEIKLENIKDNRKEQVEKEYNILFNFLKSYIKNVDYNYNVLKKINNEIWISMDKIRILEVGSIDWINECNKTLKDNDRRFRVKKKINNLCNSELKEQKGYKPRKAFVLSHLGLGDNITSIGAVRFLSTQYDEVYVVCKNRNKKNIEMFYSDDPDIKIISVENDNCISPRLGFNMHKFMKLTEGMELYLCGAHLYTKKHSDFKNIPYNFYKDFNLNYDTFWKYFHINVPNKSKELYTTVKDYKILFIHNTSSSGIVFDIDKIINILNIDKNEYLIINPNKNEYEIHDNKYSIANNFVNEPLGHYVDTIINSKYIILSDSSIFCLSLQLPIKTDNCYYVSRGNHNYDYLYLQENGFSDTYKVKKFTKIKQ